MATDTQSLQTHTTMKSLVKAKAAEGLWLQNSALPDSPKSTEVMIRVRKAAICGTDSHIWRWDEWAQQTIPVPMIVGHEYAGEIVEIGSEVTNYGVGQRVSGEGHIPCGQCRNCQGGQAHVCSKTIGVGVNRAGAFAEYLVIPESNVRPLPDSVDDDIAAILDPLGNAVHTALFYDLVGEDVLITGAGPIGCMAVAVCKHAGARNIVITDQNPERLKLAEKMGATLGVLASQWDKKAVMAQVEMQEGFDVGLEMSGAKPALDTMIEAMMTNGKIALLGLFGDAPVVDLNKAIIKGLNVKGIYGRKMYETWHKMLAMLQTGLDVSPIISHRFDLEDYEKAFEVVLNGQANKVILNIR